MKNEKIYILKHNDSITLYNSKNELFKKACNLSYNVNLYETEKEAFKKLEKSFKSAFISNAKLSAFNRLLFERKIISL